MKATAQRAPRVDNRREALLDAAARTFNLEGYASATIRDIATAAGMLPGSVYYHFSSKEELFLAVYEEGVKRTLEAVTAALDGQRDPWERLEAAVVAHTRAILDHSDYAAVVVSTLPQSDEKLLQRLTQLRDQYEAVFRRLVDELPLKRGVDRKFLRLGLIGALNWTQTWFKEGREPPEVVGAKLMALFKANKAEAR